jgi:hypothetical protein
MIPSGVGNVGPRPIEKSSEKMFCRLTVFWLLISLGGGMAAAQNRPTGRKPAKSPARSAIYSVHWQRLPLGSAVERLRAISQVELFIDRRVDPGQRIDLELSDAPVDEIVAQLALASSLGNARIGRLYYLGPQQSAKRLAALVALRRRDVNSLPPEARASLLERRRIAWPQLTEPRGLVTRLLADHGWRLSNAERIPHDLWAAGALPPMALSDQLTLLLAGFDLTYRIGAEGRAIEIVPVDWQSIERAPPANAATRRRAPTAAGGKQVYTLRVESQPVGKVLEQLSRRVGWQITVDEDALRKAGRSMDERVSFSVENADEDALLEALLAPARLKAVRDGRNILVEPR